MQNAAPCVSCKTYSKIRQKTEGLCPKKKNEKGRDCLMSYCTVETAPVKYIPNEKTYYSEMHVAWRYHPLNRKFVRKYPFCKTNYLRLGPGEELIWGRNVWDKVDYYKRCCDKKLCKPLQYRGYLAWLKPERPQDNPFYTGGPLGGLIIREGARIFKEGGEGSDVCATAVENYVNRYRKRFRFLPCGPLKPGWGCSGRLSCHLDDGFCPKEPSTCECRGVFRGEVGCRKCCGGKTGSPNACRDCCVKERFIPFKPFGPNCPKECCYICECQEDPPKKGFGRKSLFRPLEKVPPIDLDLAPYLNPEFKRSVEEKRERQQQKEELFKKYGLEDPKAENESKENKSAQKQENPKPQKKAMTTSSSSKGNSGKKGGLSQQASKTKTQTQSQYSIQAEADDTGVIRIEEQEE